MNTKTAISLFSGAGGMDVGFRQSGFEVRLAVEKDPDCCKTLRANFSDLNVINESIQDVSVDRILSESRLAPMEADLVFGGPPCQSWSLSGNRMGLNDPRGRLVGEFVRVVRGVLPKCFVMENVRGLVNWSGGAAVEMLLGELEKPIVAPDGSVVQYEVSHKVLDAADYGVPQHRQRVFFVGNRLGVGFCFPRPTHAPPGVAGEVRLAPFVSVWAAIGGLPPPDQPGAAAMRTARSIKKRNQNARKAQKPRPDGSLPGDAQKDTTGPGRGEVEGSRQDVRVRLQTP